MKKFRTEMVVSSIAAVAAAAFIIAAFALGDWQLALAELAALAVLAGVSVLLFYRMKSRVGSSVKRLNNAFDFAQKESVENFPLPGNGRCGGRDRLVQRSV